MTSGEDDLERRVRRLTVEHAETRWLALRLDDDIKEVREELRAVRAVQDEHSTILREHSGILHEHTEILHEHSARQTEHTARFDSVDAQLRSLIQLMGQALDRLPDADPGSAPPDRP